MSYYLIPCQAGKPLRLDTPGKLILIDSTGAASGVDVTLIKNGTPGVTMPSRKTAFRYVADYDGVILQTAVDATVSFFLTNSDVQLGWADGAAVSVPAGVRVNNQTGDEVKVLFAGTVTPVLGTVHVDNLDATAIPVVQKAGTVFSVEQATESDVRPYLAATITDGAPVNVTAAAGVLVAASATRRGMRIRNVGVSPVAIGGAGIVFANAAVLIQPGEVWNEDEAPGAAWYAICDALGTAQLNIQEIF